MKAARLVLFAMCFGCLSIAQQQPHLDQVTSREFLQQLIRDGVYNFISSGVADSLLVHRVEPVFPHHAYEARFSGTVIVAFEITKDGNVRHAMAVSGPALLRPMVLEAVRQWKFKPCLLNGQPIAVATSESLAVSNW